MICIFSSTTGGLTIHRLCELTSEKWIGKQSWSKFPSTFLDEQEVSNATRMERTLLLPSDAAA